MTRWLGVFGAVVLGAGLATASLGALSADAGSTWEYCGAGKLFAPSPCRCPEEDIQTTWSGDTVCFSPAPASADSMVDLGSLAVIVGALILAVGALLSRRRVGPTWLALRSALFFVASVFVAGLAGLLSSGPVCMDCPSAPSFPSFAGPAVFAGIAAALVLAAALVPLGLHLVNRSRLQTPDPAGTGV